LTWVNLGIKIKLNKIEKKIVIKKIRTKSDINNKPNQISMAEIEKKNIETKKLKVKSNIKIK
jgi:hypothetical protein